VAQKVQTLFIDDLDGSEAVGTVRFGLDGSEYEIDLNDRHTEDLRKLLAPYVDAARRSPGARKPGRGGRRASGAALSSTEVRDWAKSQGIEVKDRGRVPAELIVKFRAASGKLGHRIGSIEPIAGQASCRLTARPVRTSGTIRKRPSKRRLPTQSRTMTRPTRQSRSRESTLPSR
jgi:Lsr2